MEENSNSSILRSRFVMARPGATEIMKVWVDFWRNKPIPEWFGKGEEHITPEEIEDKKAFKEKYKKEIETMHLEIHNITRL